MTARVDGGGLRAVRLARVAVILGSAGFALGGTIGCSSDDSAAAPPQSDEGGAEGSSATNGDSGAPTAEGGEVVPDGAGAIDATLDAAAGDASGSDANAADATVVDTGASDATTTDAMVGDDAGSDASAIDGSATSSDAATSDAGDASDAKAGPVCGGDLGNDRPVALHVPPGYDCSTPAPLVILLHDYASTGALAEQYFNLTAQADALGFLYAHPDGTTDRAGNQFWNATDACCNVDGTAVDDSGYLSNLVSSIGIQYNLDRKRIAILGYGNGGFMAYRFACDHATQVTAVADLGGATWSDSTKCPLVAPVGVLEIHGTGDTTFAYDGGTNLGNPYPAAPTTFADWVGLSRCTGDAGVAGANLDLDSTLPGAETTVLNWPKCPGGTSTALWSIQGGAHQPTLSTTFASSVVTFLLAQSRP